MKEIKLMNLSLKNFKGIKEFAIDVNGADVSIYGDNATGKTTLYDAFLWLLFNKDSQNKTKFSIKTITPDGQEVSGIENEVEATFLVDGTELTLKKVHYEDWTKARNAPEATFKGNKNKYLIDDVPTPEGQYKKAIESLIDEDVFKLLTSPTYFNEQLKWTDRRKTLLDITGDLTDEDVISANKKLQELTGILQGRKIEDHKLIIAAKKTKINDELKGIPTRISEINNLLPKENIDVTSIEAEVATIEKELDEHVAQINNIKNGTAIVTKEQSLQQIEMDLEAIKRELESESTEKGYRVQAKIQEEKGNLSILKRKKDDANHDAERCKRDISEIDNDLVKMREEWAKINSREFEDAHNESVCPTCNQSLPVEEVQAAHEKALNDFNLKKSNELELIDAAGIESSTKKVELNERMEVLLKSAEELDPQIESKQKAIEKLEAELEALRNEIKDARQDAKYISKVEEQTKVKEEIESLKENAQQAVADVEVEVTKLRTKRTELNAQIAQQTQAVASKKRIAELELRQEELAKQFEQIEKELFLTEEFTRSKVDMLEEKINEKFKFARFKLFHKQTNGAINDVCETTFDGVPYGSGLNNAAKINVGLDIIQTLSEHYQFRVPIFVDNAEAVVELAKMDAQVISLVVSGADKQLRIEKQSSEEGEVA